MNNSGHSPKISRVRKIRVFFLFMPDLAIQFPITIHGGKEMLLTLNNKYVSMKGS